MKNKFLSIIILSALNTTAYCDEIFYLKDDVSAFTSNNPTTIRKDLGLYENYEPEVYETKPTKLSVGIKKAEIIPDGIRTHLGYDNKYTSEPIIATTDPDTSTTIGLTNVSEGEISENSTDVITGSQLYRERQAQEEANNYTNGRIDEVKSGLASIAALAGLLPPQKEGKLHVTAALGGYKSNAAIAAGAGYRFKNNIAVRAGLSSPINKKKSGVSYNVGIGYDFE